MDALPVDRWTYDSGRGTIAIVTDPLPLSIRPGTLVLLDEQPHRVHAIERLAYPEGGHRPACGLVVTPLKRVSTPLSCSSVPATPQPPVTVLSFLTRFHLPCTRERGSGEQPSRSEIRRWCEQHAVLLNGQRVHWKEIVTFPVWQLIFFPNSPTQRVTYQDKLPADQIATYTSGAHMPALWRTISAEHYIDLFELLPPAAYRDNGFLMGDPMDHRLCTVTQKIAPTYLACLRRGDEHFQSTKTYTVAEFPMLRLPAQHPDLHDPAVHL